MAVVKELDRVLSGKVISRTDGSFHRNTQLKDLDIAIQIYGRNKSVTIPNMLRFVLANAFYMRGNLREIVKYDKEGILGDLTSCIRILQSIIDKDCDDYQVYSLLCYALIRRAGNNISDPQNAAENDYNRAISIAEKYIMSNGIVPEITLCLMWGLYSRYDVRSKMGEKTKANSDLFRAATLARKYHELKNIERDESVIGNILADYSSALISSGRSQEVFSECKYFLDYLKAKRSKSYEISCAKVCNNVGHALALNGRPRDAIEMHDYAIEVYSRHEEEEKGKSLLAGSLNNRGTSKYISGRFDSALIDYDNAIEIAKELYSEEQSDEHKFLLARSLVSKAWLLSTCADESYREPSSALELAENACEIMNWHDVDCLYTYAAACAENNEFIKACSWQRKAVSLCSSEQERGFLKMILGYYEKKKPYRARTV